MVTLQRPLERIVRPPSTTQTHIFLMSTSRPYPKSHQAITIITLLTSPPNPPCYDKDTGEDDGAAHADDYADYGVFSLSGHAGGVGVGLAKGGRGGGFAG